MAQGATIMPLPGQTSTFTGNVRGYYFTAPVSFQIVGLMIPTDASTAAQSIEVIRLNSLPPLYSTVSNDFTSLFRTVSSLDDDWIPVSIPVQAGDIIGILGQRGTVNSYGPAGFVSSIFGNPVTLSRLGMQFPLTTNLAHDVWTENGGNISRVFMEYDVYQGSAVPEPATLLLSAGGLLLLGLRRKLS